MVPINRPGMATTKMATTNRTSSSQEEVPKAAASAADDNAVGDSPEAGQWAGEHVAADRDGDRRQAGSVCRDAHLRLAGWDAVLCRGVAAGLAWCWVFLDERRNLAASGGPPRDVLAGLAWRLGALAACPPAEWQASSDASLAW